MMSRFKYSVGPWNVHAGADAYGPATRAEIPFEEKIKRFKEIGFDAIQFHDDDAVPDMNNMTEQAIIDALEAVAPQHDVDIVDVELVGATKAPCVRVRIEGAEGQSLSLNDVTANTKWVGDVIEELDPISSSYTLEVSSPGMARPLRRPRDFARFVGEDCELTSTATEGRRKYSGKIVAATETNVTLELEDGESVTLDFSDVKKCKLKPTYDFKPAKEGN